MKQLPLGFRPNVIYIKLDDFRIPEGFGPVAAPNLNALANEMLFYPNAVCTVPLCAPNRGISFTGLHAQRNTIDNNGAGAEADWLNTWANAIRAVGVRTMLYGKFMNEWAKGGAGWGKVTELPFGFGHYEGTAGATNYYDYDTCINGVNTHFGTGGGDYCTDVEGDAIAVAVATAKPPFAIYWGCKASHSDENDLAIPANRHLASPVTPTRPPRLNPPNNGKQPKWYYDYFPSQWSASELATFDERQVAAIRAVMSFDEKLAAIRTALSTRGILDTTVIMIDVDNGFAGGQHGNDQKGTLFEECINSGLRMLLPSQLGYTGVRPQRASAVDMAETICDLFGATMPTRGHGMSLVPTFASASAPFRRESLVNSLKDGNGNPEVQGVRGDNYTAARGSPGSEKAKGQAWCWPDVDQQLVTTPFLPEHREALDTILSFV